MLPIGGFGQNTWTMDVDDAVRAVKMIDPDWVIPCHYNLSLLRKKKFAVADDERFKCEVEELGKQCCILGSGDVLTV